VDAIGMPIHRRRASSHDWACAAWRAIERSNAARWHRLDKDDGAKRVFFARAEGAFPESIASPTIRAKFFRDDRHLPAVSLGSNRIELPFERRHPNGNSRRWQRLS
jgi:hypothetical protein